MSKSSEGTIFKRRCRRYVPTYTSNEILDFLKDRYHQGFANSRPKDPFCHCGLLRIEHHEDAIANAFPDWQERERLIMESGIKFLFLLLSRLKNILQ